MKIKDVETFVIDYPLQNIADSTRKVDKVGYVILCINTDLGVTRTGITYSEVGGNATKLLIEKEFINLLIGKDPFQTEFIWDEINQHMRGIGRKGFTYLALSVIDIALWDLKAKSVGLPLYKLLGGHKKVPIYGSGGWTSYSDKELVDAMMSMVNSGYKTVKMKIGVNAGLSPDEDIKRVKLVREKVGNDIGLLVDANNAYTSSVAIYVARNISDCNIYLFEEPVIADDIEGLARVRVAIDIPVATGEHEYTKYGARDLLINKAADILQFDATKCGGFTEWTKMAILVQAWNLMIAPHAMEYVHMHLLSSIKNGLILEKLIMFEPLDDLVFINPPKPVNGFLKIPEEPGLGLKLNMKNIKKYCKF